MGLITSGRYYDHAIYVISQFAPSILDELQDRDHSQSDNSNRDDDIVDVELIDDT